jgi:hypothetical protein
MNYNRQGMFGTRPQSAGLKKPVKKNNFAKRPDSGVEKPPLVQPEWNSTAENPHKLSKAELLQRKMAHKSKNEISAKMELQAKLEKLQSGKVPKEYKNIMHKEKKFTANQAFIENKGLKKEYENRSYATMAQRQ